MMLSCKGVALYAELNKTSKKNGFRCLHLSMLSKMTSLFPLTAQIQQPAQSAHANKILGRPLSEYESLLVFHSSSIKGGVNVPQDLQIMHMITHLNITSSRS